VVIITLVVKGKLNTPDCFITATKQKLSYLIHGLSRGILLRKGETVSFYSIRQSHSKIQGVPLPTKPGISLIISPLMRILQRNSKRTYFIV